MSGTSRRALVALTFLFSVAMLLAARPGVANPKKDRGLTIAPVPKEIWTETENGWTGVFTRKAPHSNEFDAVWTNAAGAREVAVLRAMRDGATITLARTGTSGICRYVGALQPDARTALGTAVCSHAPTPFSFSVTLPAVVAPLPTLPPLPGSLWVDREMGWDGQWVRRPGTNVFDATWSNPAGARVQATMAMETIATGTLPSVWITRTQPGMTCRYQGTLEGDTAFGSYQCSGQQQATAWSATIDPGTPRLLRCKDFYAALEYGEKLDCLCRPGDRDRGRYRNVSGTDVYTQYSSICGAAQHAGLMTASDTRVVRAVGVPLRNPNPGTTRNGVSSGRGDSTIASLRCFRVELAPVAQPGERSDD